MNLVNVLPYLSTLITICIAIGGFFALRTGYSKQANEIQDRVIAALKLQNEVQARQIAAHEKEISHLKQIVTTIQVALKRRGLRIEVDNDTITLIDDHARRAHTVKIQMTAGDKDDDNDTTKGTGP